MTTSLTAEIVKAIPKDCLYIDLSGFSFIENEAAIELGKRNGESLNLNGLSNISNIAAENLSLFTGSILLNGIQELSEIAADHLSHHQNELRLNSLQNLSCVAFESLVNNHKDSLHLDGIIDLPVSVAEIISNKSSTISLKGIRNLSDVSAKLLSKRVLIQKDDFELFNISIDLSLHYKIFKHKIQNTLEIIGKPYTIQSPKKEWGEQWTPELEVAQFDFPFVMDLNSALEAINDIGDDWRIPKISELKEIFNNKEIENIPNFKDYIYWSQTRDHDDRNFIFVIDFSNGNLSDYHRNDDAYLRLVRNKQNQLSKKL